MLNRFGLEGWFEVVSSCLIFVMNAVCIGIGMFSKNASSSSFGLLLISMILANEQMYELFKEYTTLEANMVCVERLYQFMQLPVEPAYAAYCENWQPEEEALPKAIQHGGVEFRNVSVRYRADLPNIVSSLSAVIRPGEKVGIVGRTGSGKSTLVNTLLRFTELSEGAIFIDGVEIREIFIKSLRSEVTVIDQ
jgi:ABC-type multidrug transport system fused ATPase/permease subunit